MKQWRAVGTVEQLERDGYLIARLGGRDIGVVVTPDGPRAVRSRCPHQGAPLCLGAVTERLVGAPGEYALGGGAVLRCPWHGWEFNLETGVCVDDAARRVATYQVRLDQGGVFVRT